MIIIMYFRLFMDDVEVDDDDKQETRSDHKLVKLFAHCIYLLTITV